MKNKIFLVFLFSFLIPLNLTFAFGEFDIGGKYNPINIQIQPNASEQIRQQNLLLESQLKARYGYSVYASCESSACGSYNAGDPYTKRSCLNSLESWLGSNLCSAQRQKSNENIQCVPGYTKVLKDGWYVCSPIIVPTVPVKTNDQICSDKFGQNWKWDGTRNSAGGLLCGCKDDYVQNNGECIVKTLNTTIFPSGCTSSQGFSATNGVPCNGTTSTKTNDQICNEDYGANSIWSNTLNDKGGPMCDCKIGYEWDSEGTACIATPKTEARAPIPAIKKVSEAKNAPGEIKKETSEVVKIDPVNVERKDTTSTEVKPRNFWTRLKGWFGF